METGWRVNLCVLIGREDKSSTYTGSFVFLSTYALRIWNFQQPPYNPISVSSFFFFFTSSAKKLPNSHYHIDWYFLASQYLFLRTLLKLWNASLAFQCAFGFRWPIFHRLLKHFTKSCNKCLFADERTELMCTTVNVCWS